MATSLIHSKIIDYCNSLLLVLSATQTIRLQLVLSFAAHVVTNTPKFTNDLFSNSRHVELLGPHTPLVALISTLFLKCQTVLYTILLLSYGTHSLPSGLRHILHHVSSSPTLNSPVSDLSTFLFYNK